MARLRRKLRRRISYGLLVAATTAAIWMLVPKPAPRATQPETSLDTQDVLLTESLSAPPDRPPASTMEPEAATKVGLVPKIRKYKVVEGDTVEAIANRFGLRPSTILWSNSIEDGTLLQIDQELLIPAADGLIHTVADGDSLWEIAAIHGSDVDQVIKANADTSPETLQPGQLLLIPGGSPRRRPVPVASRSGDSAREEPAPAAPPGASSKPITGTWLWPLSGQITERFGWRIHPVNGTRNYHEGIDIAVPPGTTVLASGAGTVTLAEWYGGYGLTVKVDHGAGVVTRYSHNATLVVKIGDRVAAGQPIARSGNTGVSTGPHLDFGFYRNGVPIDPLTILP